MTNKVFLIDSLYRLDEAIKQKQSQIVVDGEQDLFRQFEVKVSEFEHISHLTIKKTNVGLLDRDYLIKLIKKGLEYLVIETECIDGPENFISEFNWFSCLKEFTINAMSFRKQSSTLIPHRAEEMSAEKLDKLNQLCTAITQNNVATSGFLHHTLPRLKQQLDKLKIEGIAPVDLTDEAIEFLIDLGKKYRKYCSYQKWCGDSSEELATICSLASAWELRNIIANNKVDQLDVLANYINEFDLNQKHPQYNDRLIGVAVHNGHHAMVEFLANHNADLTRCTEDKDNQRKDTIYYRTRFPSEFPFSAAWSQGNKEMKKIFIANESALYDGLAWFIQENNLCDFEAIINTRQIEIHQTISCGHFTGFTLFQLIVLHERTELFVKLVQINSTAEAINLASQVYPTRPSFTFSGWTVLAVILYKGLYSELLALLEGRHLDDFCIISNLGNDPVKLLFSGAAEGSVYQHKSLLSFSKILTYLIQNGYDPTSLAKISFIKDTVSLPLLFYVIENQLFPMIESLLENFRNSLAEQVVVFDSSPAINPLQFAVINLARKSSYKQADIDLIDTLLDTMPDDLLSSSINEPLVLFQDQNLFQYLVNHDVSWILEKLLTTTLCDINRPFPDSHDKYSGWLPIHVALIKGTDHNRGSLYLLLEQPTIEVTLKFPENDHTHLSGYYPLSAVFFNGNPVKNDIMGPRRIITDYFWDLFAVIEQAGISATKKQAILTQALLYAVIYHDSYQQHDHSKYISKLLDAGANPFQNLNNTFRVIDIAYDKGLGKLFSPLVDNSIKIVKRPRIDFVENMRSSELNDVTQQSYHILEDRYAIVSLVRNDMSTIPDHVFLIIEMIIQGQPHTHFIDFVEDQNNKGIGKIRHESITGSITEPLIHKCTKELMKIESLRDIAAQSWEITVEACNTILDSIESDKNKLLKYRFWGSNSKLGAVSGKEGDSCYSWARKKLLASEVSDIKKRLEPTVDDWIINWPKLKLVRNTRLLSDNNQTFFNRNKVIIGSSIGIPAVAAAIYYNYFYK
jgi:hypothetical protein